MSARGRIRDARQILLESMSEDQLLGAVGGALELAGYLWTHHRRSDRGQLMGNRGFPDIVAVGAGRILVLELKTERGSVEPDQQAWHDALVGAGLPVRVLRPRDLVALERELGLL